MELIARLTNFPQVRRAQLENLLANEEERYAEELSNMGKTFHTQRI